MISSTNTVVTMVRRRGTMVTILGVVDSGLYGGGMASLYHLVADLKSMDIRGQHTQQEEMHTDMKIHTLTSLLFILDKAAIWSAKSFA